MKGSQSPRQTRMQWKFLLSRSLADLSFVLVNDSLAKLAGAFPVRCSREVAFLHIAVIPGVHVDSLVINR